MDSKRFLAFSAISLMLVCAGAAKAGDSVYAETAFPVAVKNQMAIPPSKAVVRIARVAMARECWRGSMRLGRTSVHGKPPDMQFT